MILACARQARLPPGPLWPSLLTAAATLHAQVGIR